LGSTTRLPILRVEGGREQETEDEVISEFQLTIIFNGEELVTLACSPAMLESLAAGFLLSEGFISSKKDINGIETDEEEWLVKVEARETEKSAGSIFKKRFIASGGARGAALYKDGGVDNYQPVRSEKVIGWRWITDKMDEFKKRSDVFRSTGGAHSAALCDENGIKLFAEDIGRHNAIDKVFGHSLLNGIETEGKILLTSGRVSSEIVLKVARRNVPFLISKAAPTDLGVKIAEKLGITLVGFVRGNRMNIYSNGWRVKADGG